LVRRLQSVLNAAARLIVPSPPIRPYHRRVSLSPLAARARASSVQAKRIHTCILFSSSLPSWHYRLKSCTDSRCNTSVHSIASLTCLAVELFVLRSGTSRLVVPSVKLPTVANRAFPVVGTESGTIYRLMWRLLNRCLHLASGWKPISSQNHFPVPHGR